MTSTPVSARANALCRHLHAAGYAVDGSRGTSLCAWRRGGRGIEFFPVWIERLDGRSASVPHEGIRLNSRAQACDASASVRNGPPAARGIDRAEGSDPCSGEARFRRAACATLQAFNARARPPRARLLHSPPAFRSERRTREVSRLEAPHTGMSERSRRAVTAEAANRLGEGARRASPQRATGDRRLAGDPQRSSIARQPSPAQTLNSCNQSAMRDASSKRAGGGVPLAE